MLRNCNAPQQARCTQTVPLRCLRQYLRSAGGAAGPGRGRHGAGACGLYAAGGLPRPEGPAERPVPVQWAHPREC